MSETTFALIVGAVFAFIGLGVAVLTVPSHPDRASAAKWFFFFAALVFAGTLVYWTASTNRGLLCRVAVDLLAISFIAVGLIAGFRFADRSAFAELSLPPSAFIREPLWPQNKKLRALTFFSIAVSILVVVINIYLPKQDHSSPTPDQTKSDPNPVIALPIYEPFRAAYDGHKEKLGKPTMKEEPLVNTYFGQHELEKAIWIQPLAKFVFLDFHSKWTSAEDPFPDYDLTFFNDDCNRKRFGTPKHSSPPQGGVAMLWTQDMNKWKERMGWRKWHCYYRAAYLQRFEGGYVIGPFSRSPTDKVGALVFVLTNDSEWSAEVKPNDKAPTCEMVTAVDETSDPCTSKMAPLPKR